VATSIKDPEVERLAREVAALSGESVIEAVRVALSERLKRLQIRQGRKRSLADELNAIALECASLPVDDSRSPDEIIGYDEHGAPG
jgi:antitoxin VapB